MWLAGKPALHVVDTHTHFSSAIFLSGKSTKDVWNAFLVSWASMYLGYHDKLRVDQESIFKSREWMQLCAEAGIDVDLSGIESHNAIGVGERYHAPLRRIFNRVRENSPALDAEICLKIATKAMNDTMNPEGLVPSLLVFGTLPRFPPSSTSLPTHNNRMQAMATARIEMTNITAKLRVQQALRAKLPPQPNTTCDPAILFMYTANVSTNGEGHLRSRKRFHDKFMSTVMASSPNAVLTIPSLPTALLANPFSQLYTSVFSPPQNAILPSFS